MIPIHPFYKLPQDFLVNSWVSFVTAVHFAKYLPVDPTQLLTLRAASPLPLGSPSLSVSLFVCLSVCPSCLPRKSPLLLKFIAVGPSVRGQQSRKEINSPNPVDT